MLREKARLLERSLAGFDLLTVALLYVAAARLAGDATPPWPPAAGFAALAFALTLRMNGAYRSFRISALSDEMALLARAVLVGGAALLGLAWLLRFPAPSRLHLLLFLVLAYLGLSAGRVGLRVLLRIARSRGYNLRYFVIAGSGRRARDVAEELDYHGYWGIRLAGYVSAGAEDHLRGRAACLGTFEELPAVLENQVVDGVFFVVEELSPGELRAALACCRGLGIPALVDLHPFEDVRGYLRLSDLARSPLLIIGQTRLDGPGAALKRAFDVIIAAAALLLLGPLLGLIAALIRVGSPGPAIFRQQRVGMHGRRFTMLKFRTMVADAECLRGAIAGQNEMDGPVFKMRSDPRVTWLGRYLRRLSLDELPQLWNVVRGDMSIVGPRPPLPEEVERYQSWQRRRLSVRPGLTCLWQVSGRNALSFDTWMKLDLEYIDNWSWALDLKILLRTLPAMVRGQ